MQGCVEVPRNDEKHLMMQKVHLVVTYEDGKIPMSQASKMILNQLEKQYIEKREELRKIQAKYSWASDKKNPVQQSIADALMYIGFMKLV